MFTRCTERICVPISLPLDKSFIIRLALELGESFELCRSFQFQLVAQKDKNKNVSTTTRLESTIFGFEVLAV